MKIKASENWLKIIAEADHAFHVIHDIGSRTARDVQAAFDITYGKGDFLVCDHGTVITVYSVPGYVAWRVSKGVDAEVARAHSRAIIVKDLENNPQENLDE